MGEEPGTSVCWSHLSQTLFIRNGKRKEKASEHVRESTGGESDAGLMTVEINVEQAGDAQEQCM